MKEPVIEWGLAEQALAGEIESGDRCVVNLCTHRATIAVIDGLGHGTEAAAASKAAVDVLEKSPGDTLVALFQRCHERLRSTRGAAMTLARFDARAGLLSWLGAGNVKAMLLRRQRQTPEDADLLVYSGAVGVRVPATEPLSRPVHNGDVLVLATDGIRAGFAEAVNVHEDPQKQARRLLADYRKESDDAMIVVVRIKK